MYAKKRPLTTNRSNKQREKKKPKSSSNKNNHHYQGIEAGFRRRKLKTKITTTNYK